jgi:hypothetical protein
LAHIASELHILYTYLAITPKAEKMQGKAVTLKKNSMVRARERTIPTERPSLLGEVVANFCG